MKKILKNKNSELVTQKDLEGWGEILVERIDGLENSLSSRLDKFETRMDKFETRMDGFESRMDGFESRMDGFEKKLGDMKNTMMTYFDKILGKLDNLEVDNEVGSEQYRRHQIKLNDHEKRIQKLEVT